LTRKGSTGRGARRQDWLEDLHQVVVVVPGNEDVHTGGAIGSY